MLKQMKDKTKLQKGFTIIEVMIVLAIAGLILVVVLIAIPQLQRNQRNSARQANMARITAEIGNYSGNNNGKVPATQPDLDTFVSRYLADVNTEDPTTGFNMPIEFGSSGPGVPDLDDSAAVLTNNNNGTPDDTSDDFTEYTGNGGDLGVAYYQTNAQCDGEALVAITGGTRNYVVYTVLEGGAIYCLDNK